MVLPLITGMQARGPRRLLCLTGTMVGTLPSNVSLALRVMAEAYRNWCPALAADAAEQERLEIYSHLDRTLVKPPRLTNSLPTQLIRSGPTLHVGQLSRITRSDLATFLLNEARDSHHLQEPVYVCR